MDGIAGTRLTTRLALALGDLRLAARARLAATLAAALFVPLQAHAAPMAGETLGAALGADALGQVVAGRLPDGAQDHAAAVPAPNPALAAGLRMQALDDVNGSAVFQHAARTAQAMRQDARGGAGASLPDGVHLAGALGSMSAPLARTLSVDVNVSQVSVERGTTVATLGVKPRP